MRNLLNPKWLLIINTIPIVVLFFIFIGEYNVINSLLDDKTKNLWWNFGLTLSVLVTLNFLYVVFLIIKKQSISYIYGILALIGYIIYLYFYGYYSENIIPRNVPRWMVPQNMILYVGTFIMPTLAYSLFVLVAHFTPKDKTPKAWKSFLIAIIVPITWYLFSQVVLPFWKTLHYKFSAHVIVVFVITGTVVFLFFLIRSIYILALKNTKIWQKYQLAWKIPISTLLPLLGLAVNNGFLFDTFGVKESGVFGDFNNFWFYGIAVLNGIFICLPNLKNEKYRLSLFIARSITFAYTFYFFLVFLPFLPLSVVAVIAVGAGFLMLTPLVLFIIHINELSNDFKFLKTFFDNNLLKFISVFSFMLIPLFITIAYINDKNTLNETLDYLYSPDYSKDYKINKSSLERTLKLIKQHKDRGRDIIFDKQIPYLSSYFNWIVLDNLTLSDTKINNIEGVFFGKTPFRFRHDNIRNSNVEITKIKSNTRYDKIRNTWITWVDMEITNKDTNRRVSEYATTIELPTGCWISDYYLYVGNKKEMGILAEKKSAMWIFSQIRNQNKDPGILYYMTGNKVAFRIFPFLENEVRKTGIEFIHKNPFLLKIDKNNTVELGSFKKRKKVRISKNINKDIDYVSGNEKIFLPKVTRQAYYHFIIDISKKNKGEYDKTITKIERLLNKKIISSQNAKISYVNTYTNTFEMNEKWKDIYKEQTYEGGFYLERAIKKVLFDSYNAKTKSYPVIVVVSNNLEESIIEKDFSDFKITFPEKDLFYRLNNNDELEAHSLTNDPKFALSDTLNLNFNHIVLAYPNKSNPTAYLPNNNEASIILRNKFFDIDDTQIIKKNWESALLMQSKWLSQTLYPQTSNKEWLKMVRYSFMSKIMNPVTSYIVVENEAQKAMLKRKQEQVLYGNKSLDVGEDASRMTEPNLIVLAVLLLLILFYIKKRKKGFKSPKLKKVSIK